MLDDQNQAEKPMRNPFAKSGKLSELAAKSRAAVGTGHELLTPATCKCDKDGRCPVCDGGLGLCAICGRGESDLDLDGGNCPGPRKPNTDLSHKLTTDQYALRERLVERLAARTREKYTAGAVEYGGCLTDLPSSKLVDHAIDEAVDQCMYLLSLKEVMTVPSSAPPLPSGIEPAIQDAIVTEINAAQKKHGKLTSDLFRAFTILSEEVGEVAEVALRLRRAVVSGDAHPQTLAVIKYELSRELAQVAATAVLLMRAVESSEIRVE